MIDFIYNVHIVPDSKTVEVFMSLLVSQIKSIFLSFSVLDPR